MKSIPCTCVPDRPGHGHGHGCPVTVTFRFRCPECHSRRKPEGIRHAKNCILKEYQP